MYKRNRESSAETTQPARKLSDELGVLQRIHERGGEISFGAPTRCPECGAMGIVDRIERRTQHNRCLRCDAAWEFTVKAAALFADSHQRPEQRVVGSGVLVADLRDDDKWGHVTRERFIGMTDTFGR